MSAGSLVWQQLFWPQPLSEATAFGLLRHWAAQTHAPQLILGARADVTGVEYLIRSQLRHKAAVRRAVEQFARQLEPVDAVASQRSILQRSDRRRERRAPDHPTGACPRQHPKVIPAEPKRDNQLTVSKLRARSRTWPLGQRYDLRRRSARRCHKPGPWVRLVVVSRQDPKDTTITEILDRLEAHLHERGADDLILGALAGNADAIRLYERRGYRSTWRYLSKFAGREPKSR